MEVVGNDVPDNPLAVEGVLDHLPGGLQPFDEFGGFLCDGILGLPCGDVAGEFGAALSEDTVEPLDTPADDMAGDLACRTQVWRGPPGQLFRRKGSDGLHEADLVIVPT